MVCFLLTVFLAYVTSLQACPDPITIHYENYEGPIILHTANYDNQQQRCQGNQQPRYYDNQQYAGYHGNQNQKHGCCETECTCVSKNSYAPYSGSVATNLVCGCFPVAEAKPLVYCVNYGSNGYSDYCGGNQGNQGYPNCQGKGSGC